MLTVHVLLFVFSLLLGKTGLDILPGETAASRQRAGERAQRLLQALPLVLLYGRPGLRLLPHSSEPFFVGLAPAEPPAVRLQPVPGLEVLRAGAPPTGKGAVQQLFGPSKVSLALILPTGLLIAGVTALGALSLTVGAKQGSSVDQAEESLLLAAMISGLFLPIGSLLLVLAAQASPQALARALLHTSAVGLQVVSFLVCSGAMTSVGDKPMSLGNAAITAGVLYLLPAGLPALLALGSVAGAPDQLRANLEAARRERLTTLFRQHGALNFQQAAAALGLASVDEARRQVAALAATHVLKVRLDPHLGKAWTAEHLTTQQSRLLRRLEGVGRQPLASLAVELGEEVPTLEAWIDELFVAGRLDATVDRTQHEVLVRPRPVQAAGQSCDGCGGWLRPIGMGQHQCAYCGGMAVAA